MTYVVLRKLCLQKMEASAASATNPPLFIFELETLAGPLDEPSSKAN